MQLRRKQMFLLGIYLALLCTCFFTWRSDSNPGPKYMTRTRRVTSEVPTHQSFVASEVDYDFTSFTNASRPKCENSLQLNDKKNEEEGSSIFSDQPKMLYDNFPEEIQHENDINQNETRNLKKILYWNDWFGNPFLGLGLGRAPFLIGNCKYNNCFATAQKRKFRRSEIDAFIWHFRSEDRTVPKMRYPNAMYVFFMIESASHLYGNLEPLKHMFNWTFTYRRDSDIPYMYGRVVQRDLIDNSYATTDFSAGRTKMAAWFVSNCNAVSGRDKLVRTLKKHIEVDIYGKCGTLSCPKNATEECFKVAEKKYFFYLAFENSLCQDYVTEKFFNGLKYDIVPVVYGYGPYWKQAPPHSYIDVFDFTSVDELAKYLVHLSQTPYEYNEYFRWKTYFFTLPEYSGRLSSICKLCELLNIESKTKTSEYDLQDWFVRQSDCKTERLYPISKFIKGRKFNVTYNHYRCSKKHEKCFGEFKNP